jgi:hypothetical protein
MSTPTPKTRYIAPANLMPRPPILTTAVLYLLLQESTLSDLTRGIIWGLWGLYALVCTGAWLWVLAHSKTCLVNVFTELDKKCECEDSPAAKQKALVDAAAKRFAETVQEAVQRARRVEGNHGGTN